MMDDPDLLRRRAQEERARALVHECNAAASAHFALADAFEARLRLVEGRSREAR